MIAIAANLGNVESLGIFGNSAVATFVLLGLLLRYIWGVRWGRKGNVMSHD